MLWPRWLGTWVLLLSLVATATGCSPGRALAKGLMKAPNSYPDWLGPAPLIDFDFQPGLGTNLVRGEFAVGPPPAVLKGRIVEPGDYGLRIVTTNRVRGHHREFELTLRIVPPRRPLADFPEPRGTVFVLHGYGASLDTMLPWGLLLAEQGYRAVLLDLRGHGRSGGRTIHFGVLESRDLRQVLDELTARGQVAGPVSVVGLSLGSVIALRWAADDPRVAAVVALAPYAELLAAAMGLRDEYVPWIPRPLVRSAVGHLPGLLGVPPESLNTTPAVERLHAPTLFVAGVDDPVAPPQVVARMVRLCPAPAKFLAIPQVRHETLAYAFDEVSTPLFDWLATYASRPAPTEAKPVAGSPAGGSARFAKHSLPPTP